MTDVTSMDGRVIAVTGAAGGLGRAYVHELAAHGARLVLNDLGVGRGGEGGDPAVIADLVDQLRATGAEAVGTADDISTTEGAERLLTTGLEAFGEVHGLINSGGMLRDRMFVSMDADDLDAVLRGHVRAHFCPTRAFAGHWRERAKNGEEVDAAVVMTTSNAGLFSQPGQSNYAAAKAAIAGLTVTLADELERYGVRVNAISPAARTRMTTAVPGMAEMVAAPDDPDAFDVFDPANVASVVAWLVAPGETATGQVVFVRGGEIKILQGWRYADERGREGRWELEDLHREFAGHDWERTPRA
jgi:NAD(P)-dependent dehydrogenase (short-subunit alcohol dehydrogenase family)